MKKKVFLIFVLLAVIGVSNVFAQNLGYKLLRMHNAQTGVMEDLTASVIAISFGSSPDGYRLDITLGAGSSDFSNMYFMWLFAMPENVPNGTRYNAVSVGMRNSVTGQTGLENFNWQAVGFIARTQTETAFMVMRGNQTIMELYCDNL